LLCFRARLAEPIKNRALRIDGKAMLCGKMIGDIVQMTAFHMEEAAAFNAHAMKTRSMLAGITAANVFIASSFSAAQRILTHKPFFDEAVKLPVHRRNPDIPSGFHERAMHGLSRNVFPARTRKIRNDHLALPRPIPRLGFHAVSSVYHLIDNHSHFYIDNGYQFR
jgi:hypothetical protein